MGFIRFKVWIKSIIYTTDCDCFVANNSKFVRETVFKTCFYSVTIHRMILATESLDLHSDSSGIYTVQFYNLKLKSQLDNHFEKLNENENPSIKLLGIL